MVARKRKQQQKQEKPQLSVLYLGLALKKFTATLLRAGSIGVNNCPY